MKARRMVEARMNRIFECPNCHQFLKQEAGFLVLAGPACSENGILRLVDRRDDLPIAARRGKVGCVRHRQPDPDCYMCKGLNV